MIGYKHVIVGGGMVAGYCAKEYFQSGGQAGDLAIISAEDAGPYERPPLSKGFLAGKDAEESVFINATEFYRSHRVDLKLNTRVSSIDAAGRRLRTSAGDEIAFEKLVLATGAEVRTLEIPGASSEIVMYLRSLSDSKRIRDRAASAKKAVVIGGSFIAMEVASVLVSRGVETTMLIRDNRIWKTFFTPEMSAFFENYYLQRGVNMVKQAEIAAIEHDSTARLTDGQAVDCDLLVAGVGVRPVTALAAEAGLTIDNGIAVNEFLETANPNILAAGDVANYPDTIFGNRRRRVEHWDNAVSQGQYVAHALLGSRKPFERVAYFFSDVFDLSYEFWGDPSQANHVVHRGDLRSSSFSVWWFSDETLAAAFIMNRPDEERELAPELICSKRRLSAARVREAASMRDAIS